MPIPDSYSTLMTRIIQRTKEGEVNWQNTANENTIAVYFTGFALMISEGHDTFHDESFVRVALVNENGDEIDAFVSSDEDGDYRKMSQLYASGRRKAKRIDVALNTMLEELDHSDEVGSRPQKPPEDDLPF